MKKQLVILIVFVVFACFSNELYAQCAMCKSAVASAVNDGSDFGAGMNKGILYLMAIPYILLTVIGVFWYKSSKTPKTKSSQA
jgi:hypothetical protein